MYCSSQWSDQNIISPQEMFAASHHDTKHVMLSAYCVTLVYLLNFSLYQFSSSEKWGYKLT